MKSHKRHRTLILALIIKLNYPIKPADNKNIEDKMQ
jgi:hypothetical protein